MPENKENQTGTVGVLTAGAVAVAAVVFALTGGQLGGAKKINSDADLPPIASPAPPK